MHNRKGLVGAGFRARRPLAFAVGVERTLAVAREALGGLPVDVLTWRASAAGAHQLAEHPGFAVLLAIRPLSRTVSVLYAYNGAVYRARTAGGLHARQRVAIAASHFARGSVC